ncbi:MAG: tetratricopeptide repeat protein, partial [Planctomycetota bacterium]
DTRRYKHQFAISLNLAGRPDEAERVWSELVEQYPDWWHGQWHHAMLLLAIGRLDEAESIVRAAMARDPEFEGPESENYLTSLGSVLTARGEGEAALEAYRKYVVLIESREELKANRPWSHMLVAQQLARNGDADAAIETFERVRAMAPHAPFHWGHVIGVHVKEQDLAQAVELARTALKAQHDTFWSWEYLRIWFQPAEDADAAIDAFADLVQLYRDSPIAWAALGKFQFREKRYDAARVSIETALELDESYPPALVVRGELLELEGKADLAIAAYRKAEQADPFKPGDPRDLKRVSVEVARGLDRLGQLLEPTDLEAADAAYARAVRRAIATPWYHNNVDSDSGYFSRYARTRGKLGDREGALRARRNAYYADPDSFEVLYQLGVALNGVNRYEEAIPYLEEALTKEESRENLRARTSLGDTYRRAGDAKRAVAFHEKTIRENEYSDRSNVWHCLGLARRDAGDAKGAVQALEEAIVRGGRQYTWTALGKLLAKTQSRAEVRKSLIAVLDRCEGETLLSALRGLSTAYHRIGDHAARIALGRELASREDKRVAADGLFRLAEALVNAYRYDEALATLDKLDREHPDESDAAWRAHLRAGALIGLGRFDEASALVSKLTPEQAEYPNRLLALRPRIPAIRNGTDLPDPIREPLAYLECGRIRFFEREYEEAVEWFKRGGAPNWWAVWGAAAAARTGDRMGPVWFRNWLQFERDSVEKDPGGVRAELEKVQEWSAFDPVREDPAWKELWAEYDALLERARELTW